MKNKDVIEDGLDYKKIGRNIKRIRLKREMTQSDLSYLVNVTNNYISLIENGNAKVSLATLFKISKVLDISMGSLFGDDLLTDYRRHKFFETASECELNIIDDIIEFLEGNKSKYKK